MTRTYAFLLLLVAIAVLIFGIKAWIKMFSSKEIVKFPFAQKKAEFTILNPGYYSIYLHFGPFKIIPVRWFATVKSVGFSKRIEVNNTLFALRTSGMDGNTILERFSFKIESPGKYFIQIEESSSKDLLRKINPATVLNRLLSKSEQNDFFISIRNGVSPMRQIILFSQMFLAIASLIGIIFTTIYLADPKAFR